MGDLGGKCHGFSGEARGERVLNVPLARLWRVLGALVREGSLKLYQFEDCQLILCWLGARSEIAFFVQTFALPKATTHAELRNNYTVLMLNKNQSPYRYA